MYRIIFVGYNCQGFTEQKNKPQPDFPVPRIISMQLKGIILDVDGTIADTEEIHRQAFNRTFEEFGLGWRWSVADYERLLLISGGRERLRACLKQDRALAGRTRDPAGFVQALHLKKSAHYRALLLAADIEPRPGIHRLIRAASAHNILLGIATSSSRANLETLINKTLRAAPEDLFDMIVTGDKVADKKPSPLAYQCALAGLGLPASGCVAIEDTHNGNRAALGAGLNCVITTHPYTQNNDFSGAALVVDHLGEPERPCTVADGYQCDRRRVDIELLDEIVTCAQRGVAPFIQLPDIASG